jgi:hypothetical protein
VLKDGEGDGDGFGSGVSCEGVGAIVLEGVCSLVAAGPGAGVGILTSLGDFEGAGEGAAGRSIGVAAGFNTSGELVCEELLDVVGLGDLDRVGVTFFGGTAAGLLTFTQTNFFPDLEHKKFCCETFIF